MKRTISYIVLIIIFTTLGIIGYINRPLERPSNEILDNVYYRYNPKTGDYEEFKITENEIEYKGTEYNLDGCKEYTYNKDTRIIKMDCNKAFSIGGETKEGIIIEIDDKRNFFYNEKEKSFNYEFQKNFKTTESVYKSNGENSLKEIEIDTEELNNLIKENRLNFIYMKNKNCNTECTLFNQAFLEFSENDNLYYINTENLTINDIKELSDEYDLFPSTKTELEKEYPQVIVVGNNEIKEIIRIKVNGFDLSSYKNYADKYKENGVNNEENN